MLGEEERFIIELEFIQSLANPAYISFLVEHKYFENPKFIAYLQYLQYWHRPEYLVYIAYPNSLRMLSLMAECEFREQLKDPNCIAYIHKEQFYEWKNRGFDNAHF